MKRIISIMLAAVLMLCGVMPVSARYGEASNVGNREKAEPSTVVIDRGNGAKESFRTYDKKRFKELKDDPEVQSGVIESYNEYDVAKIREFLEIEDENGVKNGEKIVKFEGDYYDPDDPSTWSCLLWTEDGHLRAIQFWSHNFTEFTYDPELDAEVPVSPDDLLVGTLDVSGMQELIGVNIPQNLIDGVIADDCPKLEMFVCGAPNPFGNRVVTVSANNCPNLFFIEADCCFQESIGISGCMNIDEMFMCHTPNLTSVCFDDCRGSLRAFSANYGGLSEVDISGMNNLEFFHVAYTNVSKVIAENNNSDFELDIGYTPLTELDLSGCPNINGLYFDYLHITELDLSNHTNLQAIVGPGAELERLDVGNSGMVYYTNMQEMPNLRELIVRPYGNRLHIEGENCTIVVAIAIIYFGGAETIFTSAQPDSSEYDFVGWVDADSGEIISRETAYQFDEAMIRRMMEGDINLIARFRPAGTLEGDINGDGKISVSDALLVMRHSMGFYELSPDQFELADMNDDGVVDQTDSILILRVSLGLN